MNKLFQIYICSIPDPEHLPHFQQYNIYVSLCVILLFLCWQRELFVLQIVPGLCRLVRLPSWHGCFCRGIWHNNNIAWITEIISAFCESESRIRKLSVHMKRLRMYINVHIFSLIHWYLISKFSEIVFQINRMVIIGFRYRRLRCRRVRKLLIAKDRTEFCREIRANNIG